MCGEEEMHHEVPECRKMFYAGNCALFVKVNRLNSRGKKKGINSLQFGVLLLDVLFLEAVAQYSTQCTWPAD